MPDPIDLLIVICSHRVVSAPTVISLDKLRHNFPVNWGLAIHQGDALISRSRSMACSHFVDDVKIPFMLFIDDDILFDPSDVQRIYNSLINGYDVIGGIYPVRGAYQLASYGWGGQLPVDNEIREVEFLATGFMGISRRILEKMRDDLPLPMLNPNDWSKCYPFFEARRTMAEERVRGGDPIYISEDWDFCQKVRLIGSKVYADCGVQVGHIREQLYLPRHVLEVQGQQQAEARVLGSVKRQQELSLSLDTDLSEFLEEPLAEVQQLLGKKAQLALASMWQEKTGTAEEFYHNNKTYLYDLAAYNQLPSYYQDRLNSLLNISGQRMLDIGCGLGTAVFMLAGQDNNVTGWDINRLCIDFCLFKKQKYQLKGEFTHDKPDYSQYDIITAIDLLEHIENLHDFLLELGTTMRSGARLYHSDYFPKGTVWLMHFEEHEEHLNDWLKEAGFAIWDKQWAVRI